MKRKTIEKPLILSQAANSDFSISDKFDATSYEVNYKNFVMDVKETIKQTPNGKFYLKMVESGDGERHEDGDGERREDGDGERDEDDAMVGAVRSCEICDSHPEPV